MIRRAATYTLHRLLGQGGYGKVYQATATEVDGTKQVVALKLVDPARISEEALAGLRDEARVASMLDDPTLTRVEPPFLLQGLWAVEMAFVDGASLQRILHDHPRIPPRPAVEMVADVLGALVRLAETGFIHRDLKPGNVQLTPDGTVKVFDFGSALVDGAELERATADDAVVGTPGYIAPERFDHLEHPKGDVYALGVMLHHVITGALPGATARQVPLAPGAPEALELAEAMRHRELSERIDAAEARERLLALHASLPGPTLAEWVRVVRPVPRGLPADELVGQVLRPTQHEMPLYEERRRGKTVQPTPAPDADPVLSEVGSVRPVPVRVAAPPTGARWAVGVVGLLLFAALFLLCGVGLGGTLGLLTR